MAGDIQQLIQLRQSILKDMIPLLDNPSLDPTERFTLFSRLAQAQGSVEYYKKAYEAALALGDDIKLQSFMRLLDDIDFEIDNSANETRPEESAAAPEQPQERQPEQPAQDQGEVAAPVQQQQQ